MPHIVLTSLLVFRSLSIPLTEKSSVKSIAVKGIDKLLNTRMRIRRTFVILSRVRTKSGQPSRILSRVRTESGCTSVSDVRPYPTYVRIRTSVRNSVESPDRIRTYVRIRRTSVSNVRPYPTYVRIRMAVRNSVESPYRIRTYVRIGRTSVSDVRSYSAYVGIRYLF